MNCSFLVRVGSIAVILYSHALQAATLSIEGGKLNVPAGDYQVQGQKVKISKAAVIPITSSAVVRVTDEELKLSADKPEGWAKGTRLGALLTRGVNAFGSLLPGSLEIRRSKGGGELLREGRDYLLDPGWGHVGLAPGSSLTPNDTVFANYTYSKIRMDTVQTDGNGNPSLKVGQPHLSAPVPPPADPGSTAIAHVFIPYAGSDLTNDHIYPILESPAQAVTHTTRGRVPKTLAKLKMGQPVKIVCLGDSVTVGGDASVPEHRYVDLFAAGLRERFPSSTITVENISAGGSNSRQWLFPEKYAYRGLKGDANPARFQRVLDAKPDLVTIEFVNDAGLNPQEVEETYGDILQRLKPLGAEIILITPHFTMLKMMGFKGMREPERRPYVLALRSFAERHGVALADAAARWEHLHKEGIPYLTLLYNTINHPDDRGHHLFAEELWRCFE